MVVSELIFVSDTAGNISALDLRSGIIKMTYRSGSVNARCMGLLSQEYLLAAEKGPLIYAWQINSQEKLQNIRMLCQQAITTFSCSPDGCYLAVAVDDKLQIWQVCSGLLLCTLGGHFQRISVVTWSLDGAFVITGGDDGIVCVWKFSAAISQNSSFIGCDNDRLTSSATGVKPMYTFSDHAVRVTDIYVGNGGLRARIYTVSADKTCKIYELSSGCLVLSMVFEVRLMAIVVDLMEISVFVGTSEGNIYTFSLLDPPRTRDAHYEGDKESCAFNGHTKGIVALRCSTTSNLLVSGSADETVKIWHITSKQCVNTIQMKGPITNIFVALEPKLLNKHTFEPSIVLRSFRKQHEQKAAGEIEVFTRFDDPVESDENNEYDSESQEVLSLREELNKMKKINRAIYQFAVEKIVSKSDVTSASSDVMEVDDADPTVSINNNAKKKAKRRKRLANEVI